MSVSGGPEASPALFIGGPYDRAVIRVTDGLGVVYAAEKPPPGEHGDVVAGVFDLGVRVWSYQPTTVLLHGRQVRVYAAAPIDEDDVARATLTRDAYALWTAAGSERAPAPSVVAASC